MVGSGSNDVGSISGNSSHSRDSSSDQGSRSIDDVGGGSTDKVGSRLNNISSDRGEELGSAGDDICPGPHNSSCDVRDCSGTSHSEIDNMSGHLGSSDDSIANMSGGVDDSIGHSVDGVDGEITGSVDSVGQKVDSPNCVVRDGSGNTMDHGGSYSCSRSSSVPDHMQRSQNVVLSDVAWGRAKFLRKGGPRHTLTADQEDGEKADLS